MRYMTIVRRLVALSVAMSLVPFSLGGCGGDETQAAPTENQGGSSTSGGLDGIDGGDGDPGDFDACASTVIEGERQPVQMYIMFDKSGSMLDDQKWAGATAALTAFFQDDDSAGLNVALRFFPDDDPASGCNESACNAQACATPLVDLGTLNALPAHSDPHQAALVEAVQSRQPGGLTPMFAALAGAADWARGHVDDEAKTVVVLVTDGEPNGCNESTAAIAGLASDAATDGILTYTIGMSGADLNQLHQIASAGGTEQAFIVGTGASVHKDLVAAFEDIGTSAPSCTMVIPASSDLGEEIEPGLVNVTFLTSPTAKPRTLPRVDGSNDCDGAGGWYYDDPAAPTTIELCPASCDLVEENKKGSLELVFGCKSVLK